MDDKIFRVEAFLLRARTGFENHFAIFFILKNSSWIKNF